MSRCVEIRTYNLKPGTRANFDRLFREEALPMLQRWTMDVVAYGPSLHNDSSYFLMRSYASPDARKREQEAFYGSAEWLGGPQERILSHIENYATMVVEMEDELVEQLRRTLAAMSLLEKSE